VHAPEEPEAWRAGAAAINRYYRTFDAWAGNKTTPTNGFLEPSPEEKFADRPEFELDSLHKSAMIGTPDEVIERIKHYQDLGVDEFAYWIDNGMTHDEKKKSLELFVQQVVPAFQEQPAAATR
jgi:alkanesulfonate monooxygenase SsuD/methylene tetrahydromethanopterin reductase-like flavin-dependent oxidoreductase (luciferase family)